MKWRRDSPPIGMQVGGTSKAARRTTIPDDTRRALLLGFTYRNGIFKLGVILGRIACDARLPFGKSWKMQEPSPSTRVDSKLSGPAPQGQTGSKPRLAASASHKLGPFPVLGTDTDCPN